MRAWLLLIPFGLLLATSPAKARSCSLLDAKLTAQFDRYDLAQLSLLQRLADTSLPEARRHVERQEWETWLKVPPDSQLNHTDLECLKARQSRRIAAARSRAVWRSELDLDTLRHLPATAAQRAIHDFCAALPKGAMLHVHPSGTLTRSTASELLRDKDPVLPLQMLVTDFTTPENHYLLYPAELQWLKDLGQDAHFSELKAADQIQYVNFFALPPGNHPFERFDSVFDFVDTAVQDWDDFTVAMLAFANRAAAEGVMYVEFRMGVSTATLPHVTAMLDRIEAETGLIVRIDRSFNRTSSEADREQVLADFLNLPPNKWVVGIDLLGNERNTPTLATAQVVYGTILQRVRNGESHLHRTMHAGEIGDVRNPRDALIMGSERIGHGVLLAKDPVTLEFAARRHVPVEINLVSNLRLEAVPTLAAHPFLDYLRLGMPVSLSTDDEGIFDTDINNECVTAIETSDVTYAELKAMAYNSLTTAFVEDSERQSLLRRLDTQFAEFERRQHKGRLFDRRVAF